MGDSFRSNRSEDDAPRSTNGRVALGESLGHNCREAAGVSFAVVPFLARLFGHSLDTVLRLLTRNCCREMDRSTETETETENALNRRECSMWRLVCSVSVYISTSVPVPVSACVFLGLCLFM